MPDHKCATCRKARPVVSENGMHHVCPLPAMKVYRCLLTGDAYEPAERAEDDGGAEG